jgi:hypothetical protein
MGCSIAEGIEKLAQYFCKKLRPEAKKVEAYNNLKNELTKLVDEGFSSKEIIERIDNYAVIKKRCDPQELFTSAERHNLITPDHCYVHDQFRNEFEPPRVYFDYDENRYVIETEGSGEITLKRRYTVQNLLDYLYEKIPTIIKDESRDYGAIQHLLTICNADELMYTIDIAAESERPVYSVIKISDYLDKGRELRRHAKEYMVSLLRGEDASWFNKDGS